jgi:ABC-2 type transport system ATP-binding protein
MMPVAPSPEPAPLIARALTKRYGAVTALDALDLEVRAGELYCLLGANGAGKTTTINLFLGFLTPSSGVALVCGKPITPGAPEGREHVAYIPETVMLYRQLTGVENLEYFTALGTGTSPDPEQLLHLLAEVGLPADQARQRVGGYSKGMRQKVGIAVAMARQARVLLLDEPTSGLDPRASNEFSGLLDTLRARGAAILMATHDLFRAKQSGTRVGIMKQGRLVAQLDTQAVGHADLEQLYLAHITA